MAKAPTDIRSLARSHTATCIKVLSSIVMQAKAPAAARVAAAQALLDRGWGKPEVHVEIDNTIHWVISEESMDDRDWTKAYADSLAATAGTAESLN